MNKQQVITYTKQFIKAYGATVACCAALHILTLTVVSFVRLDMSAFLSMNLLTMPWYWRAGLLFPYLFFPTFVGAISVGTFHSATNNKEATSEIVDVDGELEQG